MKNIGFNIIVFYSVIVAILPSCTSETLTTYNSLSEDDWFDYYYIPEFHKESIVREIDSLAYSNMPRKAFLKIDSTLESDLFQKDIKQYLKLRQYEIYHKYQLYNFEAPQINNLEENENEITNYYKSILPKYENYNHLNIQEIDSFSNLLKNKFTESHHLLTDTQLSKIEYHGYRNLNYRKALSLARELNDNYDKNNFVNIDYYWITYLYAYTSFYSNEIILSICVVQDYFKLNKIKYSSSTFLKANLMMLLAENYYYVNNKKASEKVFSDALSIIDKNKHNALYQFLISKQLAYSNTETLAYSNTEKKLYLEKAKDIIAEINKTRKDYINSNRYLGLIHYDLGNTDSTFHFAKLALNYTEHNSPTTNAYLQGIHYLLLHSYSSVGKSSEATEHLIKYSFFNKIVENPGLYNLKTLITEDVLKLELDFVIQGAKLYLNDFKHSKNTKSLDFALEFSKLALQNINNWYQSKEEDALLHLYNIKREDALTSLINATYYKYSENGSQSLADSIYKYIHVSKGNILNIQKAVNQNTAKFTDTAKYLEYKMKMNDIKSSTEFDINTNYTSLYYDYKKLDDSLHLFNPDLSNLTTKSYKQSNSEFNEYLILNNTTSITFKVLEDSVYIITNNGNHKEIYKKPFEPDLIKSFYKILINPESTFEKYDSINNILFDIYVSPWISNLENSNLIIFPDLDFNNIPITSFNTNQSARSFRECKFIAENHTVSYSNSIINRSNFKPLFSESSKIVMIPFVHTNTDKSIPKLPNTKIEIESLSEIFTNFYVGYNRSQSIQEFERALGSNPQVIHIAAHGQSNLYNKLENKILFTDKVSKDLHGYKFANLNINADLLVLSACDTNLGPHKRGESQYSLARYFSIAGAKTVISSKWKLPDYSASEIVINFYIQLKNKSTITQSLQIAKSNWLTTYKGFRHPYYWDSLHVIEN